MRVPVSLESKLDLKADSISFDDQLDSSSLVCTQSRGQQCITGILIAYSG